MYTKEEETYLDSYLDKKRVVVSTWSLQEQKRPNAF